jgi:hypothetical protein
VVFIIGTCGKRHDLRADGLLVRTGENHHLWVGHLDNFQSSNLSVVRDGKKVFYGMPAEEFKTDEQWLRHYSRRLVPLDLMDDTQKATLLRTMNRRMPRQ